MWTEQAIQDVVQAQRSFFRSGATLDVDWRVAQLKRLKRAVQSHEAELVGALQADLGRSSTEAFFCDIGSTILELNETIRGLARWARPETHLSGLHCFPSVVTRVHKMPFGTTLIVSPFNFPVLLSLGPLAAATMGESRTANLGNYTYNRLLRPQVDTMRDEILVQGYTDALNKMLSDSLSAARKNYQNSSSSNNSSNDSSNWSGDIEDKEAAPDSTLWKKGNIGDNQASYGLYVLKRPAGISDEEWYKQASEWMTKQSYTSRSYGGPGMTGK